jgi:hypothetical protein
MERRAGMNRPSAYKKRRRRRRRNVLMCRVVVGQIKILFI